jgi:hypothetical protein
MNAILFAAAMLAVGAQGAQVTEQPKRAWGPEQATGAPDTPNAGDLPTAWAPLRPNAGVEWLQVGFQRPVEIAEVRIRETCNPGAVSKVVALVDNGQERVLWEGEDPTDTAPTDFVVKPKDRATANRIKIYLRTTRRSGWAEIDAVELVGADGSRQWASTASASSTYAEPGAGDQRVMVYQGRRLPLEQGQSPYGGLVGRPAKVYLDGGQSLDGVFRGSDSQFVILQQRPGNKTLLVNKSRVVYIEIPAQSREEP